MLKKPYTLTKKETKKNSKSITKEKRLKMETKNKKIVIALAKGRLAEKTMEILEQVGIDCTDPKTQSRKLIFADKKKCLE